MLTKICQNINYKMNFLVFSIIFAIFKLCSGEKILFVLVAPSKSHYILNEPLIEELVNRGHEVTVIAPYRKRKPLQNLTEILVPDISEVVFKKYSVQESDEGKFKLRNLNLSVLMSLLEIGEIFMNAVINFQPMNEFMSSNQKFDLVVTESFMMEALLAGFAHKFKAKTALISPSMPFTSLNDMIGNTAPSAYTPEPLLGFTDNMNFPKRTINFLFTTVLKFAFYNLYIPVQERLMRKYFGDNVPPIIDVLRNNCLVLLNHHFSISYPRPYLPNMIEIGGYHIRPVKPLPEDIDKFLTEATEGAIYFSLGTNLRSEEFPKEKCNEILKALSRLKQKVLWKFESDKIGNLPKNVKILKWVPQSDVLAHPNIRLFITHGGLLGLTESIFRGVPVVGIPIYGDQPGNMNFMEKIGVGIKLDYDNINEESLYNAIQKILNNSEYKIQAKARSDILKDRPMSPLDTAIFWLEYVMRHEETLHFKSGAMELPWYQFYMLDVFVFLLVTTTVICYIVKKIIHYIVRFCCLKEKRKNAKKLNK